MRDAAHSVMTPSMTANSGQRLVPDGKVYYVQAAVHDGFLALYSSHTISFSRFEVNVVNFNHYVFFLPYNVLS